jgi:hypothetical protein
MANSLGALTVELGINMAVFSEGLNKATYQARAATQQIGASLRGIGGAVSEVFGEISQFGGILGSSLGSVGTAIGKLAKEAGNLSGGLAGPLKLGGIAFAGLAAGAATAGAAVIGIAVHASESAKKLHELAQSTGVSVEELSGLSVVGKITGVDIDSLAKGLEKMDKSALLAAKSPGAVSNGYRQLGISVTDANGKLKPTSEILKEVSDKFSVMQDGAAKTALAMQIFGRAGASLIPMLNKGGDSLKYWVDYATKVGAVLDEKSAAGAAAFREELDKLELISTGVQNKLMNALLPALDHIVASIATFLESGNKVEKFGEIVGNVLIGITKLVYLASAAWDWWSAHIDLARGAAQEWLAEHQKIGTALEQAGAIPTGSTIRAQVNVQTGGTQKLIDDAKRQLQSVQDHMAIVFADLESKSINAPGPKAPGRTGEAPSISAASTGASRLPTDEVLKYIAVLEKETAEQVKLAASVGTTTEAIRAQEARAEAETQVFKLREGLVSKQTSLEQSLAQARKDGTDASDRRSKQIATELGFVRNEITELDNNKEKIIALIEAKKAAAADVSFEKSMVAEHEKIQAEISALKAETDAVFASAAAKRQAAAEAAASKITALAPSGFDSSRILADEEQLQDAAYKKKIAEEAAALSTKKGYADEVALIEATMRAYADNRDIQLAGNVAIANAQNKVVAGWAQNALAVGSFSEKWQAVLAQLNAQNQNVGQKIFGSIGKAIDGLGAQFASLAVTGKSSFASLFDSMEQEILKVLFSKALDSLINKVSGLLGLGGGDTGGIGGFFGAIFGGARAGGGPVAPGVAYLVGEKGPEAFVPSVPGQIMPSAGSAMGGGAMQASVAIHVHGASDPDTFKRAGPQIAAEMFRQLQNAYAHNGRT